MSTFTFTYSSDDELWMALYRLLSGLIAGWVRHASVPIWKRQEQEVAEDLVQTAMEKIFKSLKDARQRNEVIHSIEHWSITIAKHCFLDLIRRESRLLHLSYDDDTEPGEKHMLLLNLLVDPSQEAEEKIYEEWVLAASAKTITTFSAKLRSAILADLANRSCFDAEPTALQQAFLAAGVHLQDYQRAPSPDPAERSRQSALRSLAYKRLSEANIC